MLSYYQNESRVGFERYNMMIEEWLGAERGNENRPLLIEGEAGVGKKSLLVSWLEYHRSVRERAREDLVLVNFGSRGGASSNYFYAIYHMLIKLRERLSIDQKVELHEEKLRKYFSYWLDVCHHRVEHQTIHNADHLYQQIILVFEGVDHFADKHSSQEGNIAFWLPKTFPANVKVIVTADSRSESAAYFRKIGCQTLQLTNDPALTHRLLSEHFLQPTPLPKTLKDTLIQEIKRIASSKQLSNLDTKLMLTCFLPESPKDAPLSPSCAARLQKALEGLDFKQLGEVGSTTELIEFAIGFWRRWLFETDAKFKDLLGALMCTQKGLTPTQLGTITGLSVEELRMFFCVFKMFLVSYQGLWLLRSNTFKKAISRIFEFRGSSLSTLHQRIADSLRRHTPNSIRRLQEQTYHLYSAGNYFKLKEEISDIENFLLLFNSATKYDLCRYWQKLEERSFDPVIEYNKAIEGFETHYHPNPDDLFRIITQISRFLKEFADFQTYYTPEFRHPQLIGNLKELDDIGILGEFRNLLLCEDDENHVEPVTDKTGEENSEKEGAIKLRKKLKEMYAKISEGKHIRKNARVEISEGKPAPSSKKRVKVRTQQLNVEVKSNEESFRQIYCEQIKSFLKKIGLDGQKEPEDTPVDNEDDEQDAEPCSGDLLAQLRSTDLQRDRARLHNLPDLKNLYARTVEEEFELSQRAPTNYYYKRWIWMQFPWVCMTMKCDYSATLRKCFTSPTAYISVEEEREFTHQALQIALEAKKKKQAILEKGETSPVKRPEDNPSTLATNDAPSPKKQQKQEHSHRFSHANLSLTELSREIEALERDGGPNTLLNDSLFLTHDGSASSLHNTSFLSTFRRKKCPRILEQMAQNSSKLGESCKPGDGMLPRIKKTAKAEMTKELSELERNNDAIRKEMDGYLYRNQVLGKRLQELKTIYLTNLGQLKSEKQADQRLRHITEIESKIEKVKMQYAYSLLEHQRLDVLIKICRRNKTHNQQAIPGLVLECNNFKKMIKTENDAIDQLKKKTDQIKKLTKKYIRNCCDKIENQASVQRELRETYRHIEHFEVEMSRYEDIIADQMDSKKRELNETIKGMTIDEPIDKITQTQAKRTVTADEETCTRIQAQLTPLIDITNEDYKNDPRFIRLAAGLAKRREFLTVLESRRMELDELRKRCQEEQKTLKKLKRSQQPTEQQDQQDTPTLSKEQLEKDIQAKRRVVDKLTQQKLSCLGVINTWYAKIGLPEQNSLILTPALLGVLKALPQ